MSVADPKTVEEFRKDFGEFASDTVYPDETVQFWLDQGYGDLNEDRFGTRMDMAVELFVAHMLVLGQRNAVAAAGGNAPGAATGIVTSRSVDKVSVSYDASMVSEKGAGFWNLTTYGLRFYWMLRQFCLGPVYRAPAETRFLR